MFNKDVREYAKKKRIFLWQVAKAMSISEPTMTRKLRSELPEQSKQKIFSIIDELSAEETKK